MARKSKRMALYEAIRQGQVKIAKGLESGQMRSDSSVRGHEAKGISDKKTPLIEKEKSPRVSVPFDKWLTIVKGVKTRPPVRMSSPLRNKWSAAIVLGSVGLLVLLFGVWFGLDKPAGIIDPGQSSDVPAAIVAEKPKLPAKETPGLFGGTAKPVPEKPAVKPAIPEVKKESPSMSPSGGPNVIVIQTISAGRKDELNVLKDYFARKGVETEIIIDRSGYAILATKQGFVDNPESSGTDGYRLLQKIQQLGQLYPEETKDTKFGLKPFQDAYGYKR